MYRALTWIHQSEMFEIEIYDLVLRSLCAATSVEY